MSAPRDRAPEIRAALRESPGMGTEALFRLVRGNEAAFRRALRDMEATGEISLLPRGPGKGRGWFLSLDVTARGMAEQVIGLVEGMAEDDHPTHRCPPPETELDQTGQLEQPVKSGRFDKLIDCIRNGARSLEVICDKLGIPPGKAKALIDDALDAGLSLRIDNDHVGFDIPQEDLTKVNDIDILPVSGDQFAVGVFSDTHYGSRFCLRHQIIDYIKWAQNEHGVDTFLHVGDWTQGIFDKHSIFEVTQNSQEGQLQEMADWLPRGPHYIGIAGNHDEEWTNRTGLPFKRALESVWQSSGRADVEIVGSMGAFVRVGGLVVYLWHGGSANYALSYDLQKKAQEFAAIKPHVLLQGHVHQNCQVEARGIECIMVPAFQGGAAPFSKKQRRSPALGGHVLKWKFHTGSGIRDFDAPKRRYYEREGIFDSHNNMPGVEIAPVDARTSIPGAPSRAANEWHSCTGRPAA